MRRELLLGLAAPLVASPAVAATDDGWLSRPIRFIVPFPPGGPTDAVSRLLTLRLSEWLKANVIVENVGGAGGSLGMERLTRSAADGSTIGLGTTGTHAINRHLYARLPYHPVTGFTPLSVVIEHINMLVVNADHPARSLADLLDAARKGGITYGSAGNGSSNHLSAELLGMKASVPLRHIPFRGSGPAMAEVVPGRVDGMFDTLAALPQVESGRVRVLAVTGPKRHRLLPDAPAIAETIPGYEVVAWFGVFAPAQLPAPTASKLNAAIVAVVGEKETGERLRTMGLDPASGTPGDLAGRIARDDALWGPVIRAAGLRPG